LEDRDDLSELLLNGLPPEEREHVIDVIKQGDEAKLRRLRAENTPEQREPGSDQSIHGGLDDEDSDDPEMADASD
jgi:hypothetical protein